MKKKLIMLVGGLALFVLLSAGVVFSQPGPETLGKDSNPALGEYMRLQATGELQTKDAFLKQADHVKEQHTELEDSDYFVTITFMKRANYDDVDGLIKKYKIEPTFWDAQWQDSNNMTVTAATRLPAGPERKSKDMVRGYERNQDFGFIDLSGDMPGKKVAALQAEELVFLVDTRGDLRFMSNPEKKRMPTMYYKLVEFGLNTD